MVRARFEARQSVEVRNRAEANHEVVVPERVWVMIESMRDDNTFPGQIDRLNLTGEEAHSLEHLANGVHDRGEVKIARCHFVQHGREEEEVFTIDYSDPHVWVSSQSLFELHRHIQTGEAAAPDQDSFCRVVTHLL